MPVKRFFSILSLLPLALAAACGKGGGGAGGGGAGGGGSTGTVDPFATCDPGENIFCRCPGGEAGTKTCKIDGHTFEACVTRDGPCPEISAATSSSSSAGGTGGGGSGGGTLGGLYDPCAADADCASGICPMGYCTKDCAKYDECDLGVGECVAFMGALRCMPVCVVTSDCEDAYGKPSACGYANAADGFPVTTCADWEASLEVPPEGTECADDLECNLGNQGVQAVCSFDACTKGCYTQADCPPNTTCSSTGALGSCK
jgi:hypothetical protein